MRKLISLLLLFVYVSAIPVYAAEEDAGQIEAPDTGTSDETATNQEGQQKNNPDEKTGTKSPSIPASQQGGAPSTDQNTSAKQEKAPAANGSVPVTAEAKGAEAAKNGTTKAKEEKNAAAPQKPAQKTGEEKVVTKGKKTEPEKEKKEEKPAKAPEEKPAATKEKQPAPLPAAAVPKQVAEKPAPVKEKAHPAYYNPEESEIEAVDIDTIDLSEPKGNWLLKRQWWEAAERAYEQIKKIVDQIFDARLTFYNERTDLDRTVFNNFFHSVGMGQGELQEIVETLTQEIDQDAKKGALSKEEKDIMGRVKDEKDRLKKLYDTIEHINEIEKALNAALITMREQIESARENERKAWKNFKDIARELSDHKAYELYYAMNSFMTNVSEIYKYLHGPFADYYRQLGGSAKKDIGEVLESMKVLKEKGIDLKQQAEGLHKQQCARPEAEKEEESEEKSTGFFGTLWDYIKAPFAFIASSFADAYDGVRSLFVKAPVDEEEESMETAKPKQNKESAAVQGLRRDKEAAAPKKAAVKENKE